MINAINTKDKILNQLNTVSSSSEFIVLVPPLLNAIELFDGFWQELGYSYKAMEICERISNKCDSYLNLSRNLPEDKEQALAKILIKSNRLKSYFFQLQQERIHDVDAQSQEA